MTTVQYHSAELIKTISQSFGSSPMDAMLLLQFMAKDNPKELARLAFKAKMVYAEDIRLMSDQWRDVLASGRNRVEEVRGDIRSIKHNIWPKTTNLSIFLKHNMIFWKWQLPQEHHFMFSTYRGQLVLTMFGLEMPDIILVNLDRQIDGMEEKLWKLEREVRLLREFLGLPHEDDDITT